MDISSTYTSIQFSFVFDHLLSQCIHDTYDCKRADRNPLAKPLELTLYFSLNSLQIATCIQRVPPVMTY